MIEAQRILPMMFWGEVYNNSDEVLKLATCIVVAPSDLIGLQFLLSKW